MPKSTLIFDNTNHKIYLISKRYGFRDFENNFSDNSNSTAYVSNTGGLNLTESWDDLNLLRSSIFRNTI